MIIEVVGKEIEKIKGDFESYLNGLNMVGEISYSQYSELYDEGTKQIQRAYELGKSELEKENAELKETVIKMNNVITETFSKLTKAKVALRNVIDYLGQFCSDYPDCVIEAEEYLLLEEAEQFLKDNA